MNESRGEVTELENRHRKQRKELQAQIQALKRAAKNDKTKKKELTAEIAKLETDLHQRQQQEIEAIVKENDNHINSSATDDINSLECELTKVKVSKAQKRRDKKSQQEKQRQEEIKQQEKENLHGPRNLEIEIICKKLKEKRLKLFPIPSDGDCLYKAVVHQLEILRQTSVTVDYLRKTVAIYIKENKDDFIPFMSNNTDDMMTDAQFEDYCDKIMSTKVWGGQLEIRALSNSLKCPIIVIQATGPNSIEQGLEFGGPGLVITYHRHMYSLGEHYNSTEVISDQTED